jgi:2,5-diketo-D-gluconate reductase B
MEVPKKKLSDGVEIPTIGFGTWQLEGDICYNAIKNALEVGYRHIDTAYIYHNHSKVKEAIVDFPREELFFTTKLWREHLAVDKVEFALDLCLKQLGLEYIDLFLIHWPDSSYPLHETVKKMYEMKEKGKVRSVGVSNFTISHLQELIDNNINVSVNQVEFHPYLYQKELLEFCNKNNIALTAYSPLARGNVARDPLLQAIGKKYSKLASQVSLRWLIQKNLIVIPKGSSKSHIKENIDIFDFVLSDDDVRIIDAIHLENTQRHIAPDFHEFNH